MSEDKDKIIETLRRLKELADRGEAGEKLSAQLKLNAMLNKYNISIDDLDVFKDKRSFEIPVGMSRDIMTKVIMSIDPYAVIKNNTDNIEVYLNDIELVEVNTKYEFLNNLYNKTDKQIKELLNMAFFSKYNDILSPDKTALDKKVKNNEFTESYKRQQENEQKIKNMPKEEGSPIYEKPKEEPPTQKEEPLFDNQQFMFRGLSMILNILPDVVYVKSSKSLNQNNK